MSSSPTSEDLSPSPTKQVGRTSTDSTVGHIRPSSAATPRIDVPQLKNFRAFPGPFYFLSYANTSDLLLYALGSILSLLCALPFSGIDILYGRWASGLVNPNPDGSPPSPASIRALSQECAFIGIGITFGMWITTGGFFFCMSLASSRVVARMRRAYLAAVLAQDATHFEEIGPGEVASRLQRDLEMVKMGCGEKLGFILWSVGGIICGITVSFWAAPRVGGVLFSILPYAALIFVTSGFVSERASTRMAKSEGEAASFLEQLLSSIRIVKVFQASKPLVGCYDDHLGKIQKDSKFIALSKGLTYAGSYSAIFFCYSLAFWYGGRQVAFHGLDTGKLITSFFSMFNASFAIVNILPHITAFSDALKAQARIRIEIERPSRIDHRLVDGISTFASQAEKQEQNGLAIELKNVSFAFPSRLNHKSLDNVSLTIPAGSVVALVGASGSGKSTITALLLRQFELPNPESRTDNVFIDSQPVSTIQVAFLRSQIAIVSQDPQLTSGSILENVAVGLTGTANELKADRSNLDEVEALCRVALEAAQAWSFVQRLPQGVHTNVSGGKTGVLSGGQRQRISIARALVRRPKILLMDEATSALDSQTEGRVQKAIAAEQKARGITVVLIAHRLSTVRDADKIIVMGSGRKLEEGSHEELVELNGAYAQMLQRHHGVVPGDDSQLKEQDEDTKFSASSVNDYEPPTQHQPLVDPTLPTPHHLPAPTLRNNTSEIYRPTSRPGARGNYSFGMQQAEEAQASVEKASADSKTTGRGQWERFLSYVKEQKRWIIPGVICSALLGASFPAAGYLTGATVHALSDGPPSLIASSTARFALYFLIIALANVFLCFSEGWFLENGSQRLTRRMRKTATEAILRQEVGWFDDEQNASGGLSASIASHPSQVAVATGLVSGRIVVAAVNMLGSLIVALVLSWDVTLVGFAPLLILIPVGAMEVVCFGKYETESERPTVAATSYASESIDAIKTVAAYGREKQVVEQFDRLQQPNVKAHRNALGLGSIFFGLGQASFPLLVVLVFSYGGDKFAKGQISITNLFAVFEMSFIGAFAVGKAFGFIGDISRSFHSFRVFSKWIERLPLVARLNSVIKTRPLHSTSEKVGGADIIFSKVQLVYPTRPERPAIHELDLHIKAGEKVAFCGPSGGGKSSVLALLARFYESSRGVITVDGEDIRAAELVDHYERISLVSQDAVLYEGTVAFNLTLGLTREVSTEEMRAACADACILDFVDSLPEGFESSIGLKGGSMSGGQRQRICIARALLRNAKILLLDEATSALDNESESLVQRAIDRASVGRTTLTVAHRLSTIRNADRIFVLEDGRIKESGTHDELVKKGGRYVELIEAQL